MTLSDRATFEREHARNANGTFGSKANSDPGITLAIVEDRITREREDADRARQARFDARETEIRRAAEDAQSMKGFDTIKLPPLGKLKARLSDIAWRLFPF